MVFLGLVRMTIPLLKFGCILLIHMLCTVLTFNLDLESAQTFQSQQSAGGYFGYSLALYSPLGTSGIETGSKLLVGAPLSNRSELLQQGILNSGALFECDIDTGSCVSLKVNDEPIARTVGMEEESAGLIAETRSNQWLGATLSVSKEVDFDAVVVCAPLYVYHGPRGSLKEPTGECYLSRNSGRNFTKVSPCKEDFDQFYRNKFADPLAALRLYPGHHKTGHGQCGFSVDVARYADLGIGSVGSYNWQGKLYGVQSNELHGRKNWQLPPNALPYSKSKSTQSGEDYYSYKTWAVKSIQLDSEDDTVSYVISAPRANLLRGWLRFYTHTYGPSASNMEQVGDDLEGEQAGAYYGYALAIGDFNGDGDDDVAVSAPFWTDYKNDEIEIGKVYIHYQTRTSQDKFGSSEAVTYLEGESAKGRFGLSVEYLGDLNHDRYGDLAVGAPYAGPNNRGAVYIYNGGKDGISTKYSQVVYSENIVSRKPLEGFGWSISGGHDVDRNRYSDMAVGAYKSDQAIVLRSRPLVKVTGQLFVSPNMIKLQTPCNVIRDPDENTRFQIRFCAQFDSVITPEEISLKVVIDIDSEMNLTKRAFTTGTDSATSVHEMALQRQQMSCLVVPGYVNPDIRDKRSNISVSAQWELARSSSSSNPTPLPMLDVLSETTVSNKSLYFATSCESCEPNLKVQVETQNENYILGSDDELNLKVMLANHGQDSYLTELNITIPENVSFKNIHAADQCIPLNCRQLFVNGTESPYISCDAGNPFPRNQRAEFMIKLGVSKSHQRQDDELMFSFNVASRYAEDVNITDNKFTLSIPLKVVTSISVTGNTNPQDAVIYNRTHLDGVNRIGPHVSHQYEVYTVGPSSISEAEIIIDWPLYSRNETSYLLYLYKQFEIKQGTGNCSVGEQHLNPENVLLPGSASAASASSILRYRATPTQSSCQNNSASCNVQIKCRIHNLSKEQSFIVKISSFLWMSKVFGDLTQNYTKEIVISSSAVAKVTNVPYLIKPDTYPLNDFTLSSYFVKFRINEGVKPFDLKWILIGVGIGLFLLIIIILVMWRCGFFKRYRPHHGVKVEHNKDGLPHETQPLHSTPT